MKNQISICAGILFSLVIVFGCSPNQELKEKVIKMYEHSATFLPSDPQDFKDPRIIDEMSRNFNSYCEGQINSDEQLKKFFDKMFNEIRKENPDLGFGQWNYMSVQIQMKIVEMLKLNEEETSDFFSIWGRWLGQEE